MAKDSGQEIRYRTFVFAYNVARLALSLAPIAGVRSIVDQLLKAGTGIGANLEEAKAGSSRKEFERFVEIALCEARESVYWLRIDTKRRMRVGVAVTAFCIVLSAALVS